MINHYESIDRLGILAIEEPIKIRPEVFASFGTNGDHCIQDSKHALVSILKQRRAKGLFVSAAIGNNVNRVSQLVEGIGKVPELKCMKIVVGGYTFNTVEGLGKAVGADGYAKDAEDAVLVANDLMG